jgi:hypothetical protein
MRYEDDPRPVVFLAFSNSAGDHEDHLDHLAREYSGLRKVLEGGTRSYVVVDHAAASAADVFHTFLRPELRHRIAVFHFAGHADGYGLLMQELAGRREVAHAGGLAAFLGQQRGLHLVFLNGCATQGQVAALLGAGIPLVVATSQEVHDEPATAFAIHFYTRLAAGDDVATAFGAATAMTTTTHGIEPGGTAVVPPADRGHGGPWRLYEAMEGAARWGLRDAADPCASLPKVPEARLPSSPYRDLLWFGREHAELFFGRCHEIRRLHDLVTESSAASDPIILLYGQSGVGKSSLIEAGLVPRLLSSGATAVLSTRRDPQIGLLGTIEEAIGRPMQQGWIGREIGDGKPLVVILDQVEEAFTRTLAGGSSGAAELDELLEALVRGFMTPDTWPQGKLLLSFRKEWLADVVERLRDRSLPHTTVFVEPLQRAGIVQAITGPTRTPGLRRKYGLTIPEDEDLPDLIALDLLHDPKSPLAPTLQVLLTAMWKEATTRDPATPRFTKQLYHDLRHRGLHLDDFLERRLEAIRARSEEFVASGLALDVLAFHTTPLGTAAQRSHDEVAKAYRHRGDAPQLVQALEDEYLLADPPGAAEAGRSGRRLAHDTLGPLIRHRFERSDAPGQRARRILEARTADWVAATEGPPLDRHDLAVVERGAHGMRARTELEERLVASSHEHDRTRRRWAVVIGGAVGAGAAVAVVQVLMDMLVGSTPPSFQVLPRLVAAAVWPSLLVACLIGGMYTAEWLRHGTRRRARPAPERAMFARSPGWPMALLGAAGFGLASHVLNSGGGAVFLAFTPVGWSSLAPLWVTMPFLIGLGLAASLRIDMRLRDLGRWGWRLGIAVTTTMAAQVVTNTIDGPIATRYSMFLLREPSYDWGLCAWLQSTFAIGAFSCALLPEAALLAVALTVGMTFGTIMAFDATSAHRDPRERSEADATATQLHRGDPNTDPPAHRDAVDEPHGVP